MSRTSLPTATLAAFLTLLGLPTKGRAQDQEPEPSSALDSVAPRHQLAITPHRVVLTPGMRTTTLTITNRGDKQTEAEVMVVFAYSVWPHGLPWDTTLFTADWKSLVPRDTIVLAPRATDPSLVAWLSGAPTHVSLKPHETRTVTLKVTPPPTIPNREYWARVVTEVRATRRHDNPGKPKDEKTIYKLPVHGITPAPLRDSTLVFYRPGAMQMGLRIPTHVVAQLDANDDYPHPPGGCPCRRVWYRLPVRLTGNATFQGTLRVTYEKVESGEEIHRQNWELTVYHDAVLHGWSEFHPSYPPGKYRFIATFTNVQSDLPGGQWLPMTTVSDTTYFEVPQ